VNVHGILTDILKPHVDQGAVISISCCSRVVGSAAAMLDLPSALAMDTLGLVGTNNDLQHR